jgi:hypothetical protein
MGMIIDTPWNCGKKAIRLASSGVDTVIRYYNHSNSAKLPEKRLTPEEARRIGEAGMNLAVVFQQRQSKIEDFTYESGVSAGKQAHSYAAQQIGQPRDSVIYLAVDSDFTSTLELSKIKEFFAGFRDGMSKVSNGNPLYSVGAYGSGKILFMLSENGLATYFWLAMSKGWSGYREFLESGNWHLLQLKEHVISGIGVDYNKSNEKKDYKFGQFEPKIDDDPFEIKRYRVIASKGLNIRSGPGTDYDIEGFLRKGEFVIVLSMKDDPWFQIDVEGDGFADGYCHSRYLEPVEI